MRRGALTVLAVVLWIGLTAGAGLAQRAGEPKKASKLELSLVRNYNDCTTPNDTSAGTISLPACHPLVPADTQCSFDPAKGQGTLTASVSKGPDLKVQAKVAGIAGCDGQTLCLSASIKLTTNACTSGDAAGCTTQALDFTAILAGLPKFCCTVTGGKCKINTTANAAVAAGTIVAGQQLNVNIGNCGLQRTTGTGAPAKTFACGLLIP